MELGKHFRQGLEIFLLKKSAFKQASMEQDVDIVFISVLFVNYIISLLLFGFYYLSGGIVIGERMLLPLPFFGLLLLYPIIYNTLFFFFYSVFIFIASLVTSLKADAFITVGYHIALVYSALFFVNFILATISLPFASLLFSLLILYFILLNFKSLQVIYNFSLNMNLLVLFVLLFLSIIIFLLNVIVDNIFML